MVRDLLERLSDTDMFMSVFSHEQLILTTASQTSATSSYMHKQRRRVVLCSSLSSRSPRPKDKRRYSALSISWKALVVTRLGSAKLLIVFIITSHIIRNALYVTSSRAQASFKCFAANVLLFFCFKIGPGRFFKMCRVPVVGQRRLHRE